MTKSIIIARIYPNDWWMANRALTLPQRGFMTTLIMAMHEYGGAIPADDEKRTSMILGIGTRTYRMMRDQLTSIGVVKFENGTLYCPRTMAQFKKDREAKNDAAATGAEPGSGGNSSRIRGELEPNSSRIGRESCEKDSNFNAGLPPNYITIKIKEEEKRENKSPNPSLDAGLLTTYVDKWNKLAEKHKLPRVSVLTSQRAKRLRQRIAECGPGAWDRALEAIERSSFLLGRNDRGWQANFDFLVQPNSFAKVLDGAYGRDAPHDRASTWDEEAYVRQLDELALQGGVPLAQLR